ncbi:MAG: glucose-1-phosphate cytidylyltransferase [Pseudomonadota bacterium]
MKAVIFAGGFGTRISEESGTMPKPLITIGEKPILWHIMKIYAAHGVKDFIVCCGYKGHLIKQYFADYFVRNADITFDLKNNSFKTHAAPGEDWTVTCVDTGLNTMTAGRLKRVREFVGDETFCLTYGDGVSDVDITALVAFHKERGATVSLTAVQPPGRFGALQIENEKILAFREKPSGDGAFINGGFFVCEPEAFDLIDGDDMVWEREPLETLAKTGKLAAYTHQGFWQPMDTLRDRNVLEDSWASGAAPWKVWS